MGALGFILNAEEGERSWRLAEYLKRGAAEVILAARESSPNLEQAKAEALAAGARAVTVVDFDATAFDTHPQVIEEAFAGGDIEFPAAGVRHALKTGVTLAAVLIPLQILVGDAHGLNTFHHQPAKLAAIEGVWHTERGAPLLLFALPDEATQSNRYAVGIPKLASLIITHQPDGEIRRFGVAPWNAEPAPTLAPGATVLVPVEPDAESGLDFAQLNGDLARFLATQPLPAEARP